MNKNIIAVDGPAASGKGTLSKRLADALNFAHMDTGALYRAAAYELMHIGLSPRDKHDARDAAKILLKKLTNARNPSEILGNPALRHDEVGQAASQIAAYDAVREVLIDIQRDFARNPGEYFDGAVLDGRDIGTVICPDAPLKLFITASTQVRAQRRLKELQSRGITTIYSDVLNDMRMRDERDQSRSSSPLKAAKDALTIDSSDLDADQMFEKAMQIAKKTFSAD